MGENKVGSTIIQGSAEKKSYEKGFLSFVDIDREVKILCTTEILIGRDDVCDIRLDNNRISRKHAVIQLEYGSAKFVDLMSSNGTTRNDEPVKGTIILCDGDKLVFGGIIPVDVKLREEDERVMSVTLKVGTIEFLLAQAEVLIGRNAAATDITINDPLMNTLHAQLEFLFEEAILSSFDEEKPILINGMPTRSTQLKNYAPIQIGGTRFTWKY